MMNRKLIGSVLVISCLLLGFASQAGACAGCWRGYGEGDERFNKPLADIRIIYEKEGKGALPYIRNELKTSTDPLVLRRAAGYIVALDDRDSIPLMEDMILMLVKRVSFGKFGLETYEFQGRLAVANALPKFGPTNGIADRIWAKYERLDFNRKDEVPYILNGLEDPKIEERLFYILNKEEDHQLMLGALAIMADFGDTTAIPELKGRMEEWEVKNQQDPFDADPNAPMIYYSVLISKAQLAMMKIEERARYSALQGS